MTNRDTNPGEESEKVVRSTFKMLAEWQTKVAQPYRPDAATDLEVDDQDWPGFPTSTVAWSGLSAATDHLNAIRRHVEAGQLFPMAHSTLCRTALVGAAQVVWVLAPKDRADRLARSRTIVAYVYKNHLQYLRGLQGLSDTPHTGTDTVANLVDQRINELALKRAADNQNENLNTTKMIKEAAQSAFTGAGLVEQVVLAWQSGSGAAHGLPWHLFGTPGMSQTAPAGSDGVAEFAAVGSLSRIANAFMAAFHLSEHGWRMLEQRGSAAP